MEELCITVARIETKVDMLLEWKGRYEIYQRREVEKIHSRISSIKIYGYSVMLIAGGFGFWLKWMA